jgi:hypothetical protein
MHLIYTQGGFSVECLYWFKMEKKYYDKLNFMIDPCHFNRDFYKNIKWNIEYCNGRNFMISFFLDLTVK